MSLEGNIQKLRDSLAVTSAQTLRHEALLKDHAEWLHSHDKAMIAHEKWLETHKAEMAEMRRAEDERGRAFDARLDQIARADAERGRALDDRIDKLVIAIGKLISERGSKN